MYSDKIWGSRSSCKSGSENDFSKFETDLCQNDYLNSHVYASARRRIWTKFLFRISLIISKHMNFICVIQMYIQLCTEMKQTVINACRNGNYCTDSIWDPFHLPYFQFCISSREGKARMKNKDVEGTFWNSMQFSTACLYLHVHNVFHTGKHYFLVKTKKKIQ